MKKLILIVTTLFTVPAFAQDFVDNALLFSRVKPGGSARMQSLGGAQVSLGGDYSSGLSNPAGLGMFNRSEFTFSTGLNLNSASSDYLGVKTNDSKGVFNIPGLSLVFHSTKERESGFLGGSFGISMSRTNDLHRYYRYTGENNENSLIDYFIADAYGINPNTMLRDSRGNPGNNFFNLTALAYNNYLIFNDPDNSDQYQSVLSPLPAEDNLPAEIRTIDQEEINESKGAQYQWSFSYGANFNDKFFIGAGLGITSIKYKIKQVFKESNYRYSADEQYNPLDHFKTEEGYDIKGSGVNLTIGTIYRPVEFVQLGASLVTPTLYSITDKYTARVESLWNRYDGEPFPNDPFVYEEFDQPLITEYSFTTPMRFTAGATLISKFGFISGDVEFVNYSKAKYRSEVIDENFDFENQDIRTEYTSTVNFRFGGEYRHDNYRIRAGYNYMPDPYSREDDIDRTIHTFSGGLGYRTKTFYIDLATIVSKTNGRRVPYFLNGPDPVAKQKFTNTNFIVTVGFPF
jgi:hypothetical protein